MFIFDEHHLLSSRAAGPADGAPNDWRRALRLRSLRSDSHRKDQDVFTKDKRRACPSTSFSKIALSRPGGHGGVAAPVPIPNTAAKRPSANGTLSQDAGE